MFSDSDADRLLASNAERAAWSGEDLAKVLGAFRKELVVQGFSESDAADYAWEFFLVMIAPEGQRNDDDDE